MSSTVSKKPTIWSRNFICVLLANSLLVLSHNSVNTLVSTYATHLGAGPRIMGLLTGMFFGVALAMRPVAGPITTRIDKRKLMIFVYSLGCLVNIGYALFHSITAFVIFRFFNGIQYALVGSLCITIAGDSLPAEKMASGLGVFGVGSAATTAVAPSIGLWLKDIGTVMRDVDLGFTFVFLFAAISLGLAVIPSFLLDPDKKSKEDLAGAGKWYTNIASKYAIAPSIVMMLLIMAYSLYNSYMVPFGEELGVAGIGAYFTVLALGLLCSRPLSGTLTDRFGLRKILIPAMIIFAASFFVVSSAKTLPGILIGAIVVAIGYGAANPAMQSMCMQCETPVRRAVASNTLYIGMDLGLFLGPLLGGFVKDFADYKDVIFIGCIPAVLALVVFLICWPAYEKRIKEITDK